MLSPTVVSSYFYLFLFFFNVIYLGLCCCRGSSLVTASRGYSLVGLPPCLGYCKQYCYEHWGACIFSNQSFHLFQIYAQEWDCWIIQQFYFQFFKEPPYCSLQCLYPFTFPPTVKDFLFSTLSQTFIIHRFFDESHLIDIGSLIQTL